MVEHKTDMNIAKIDKYKKNWTTLLWRRTKKTWTLLKLKNTFTTEHKTGIQLNFGEPNKGVKNLKTPKEKD